MDYASTSEKDRLARRLGVDTTHHEEVVVFEALFHRYGPQLVAAKDEGWFDTKPVAPSTLLVYRRRYAAFERWAEGFGLSALPASPAVVEAYAQFRLESGVKPSTVGRELDAIDWRHRVDDLAQPGQSPRLREWKAGAARSPGQKPVRQSVPLTVDQVGDLVDAVATGAVDWSVQRENRNELKRRRTAALFLFLFATGIRISDAIRLKAGWVVVDSDGFARVDVPRSKNHPQGVPYRLHAAADPRWCPVRALIAWMEAAAGVGGLPNGRLFPKVNPYGPDALTDPIEGLEGERLWKRIKGRTDAENRLFQEAAGHTAMEWNADRYALSTRSFRRGLATAAHEGGAEISHIQRSLAHRLYETSMVYVEGGSGRREGSAVRKVLS